MRAEQPRVVVTGLGAITPLGGDVPTTWESMLAGRSGARALTVVCTPARAPSSMPIQPAEPFGMSIGMAYGDTRCQPRSRSVL